MEPGRLAVRVRPIPLPRGVTGNTGGFEPPDSGSSPGEAVFYGRIEGPGRSETRFEKVVADAIQKAEDGGMELHQNGISETVARQQR